VVAHQVGAIHGRLLTAWSTAGVLGPIVVNAIADARADVQGPAKYTPAFIVMIVLLAVGFVANEVIRPVAAKWHEPEEVVAKADAKTEGQR
jgi:hypothetical protein